MTDLATLRNRFLDPLKSSSRYTGWAADNPREAERFVTFTNMILQGKRPDEPAMRSAFGRALIGAALPYLPAAPPPAVDPFSGAVCFTEYDPLVLVRLGIVDRFDSIAVKGDGSVRATARQVDQLYEAGAKQILTWYSWDNSTPRDVFGPLIAQDEGPGQRGAAETLTEAAPGKVAIVTNSWATTNAGMGDVPWYFAESEWGKNPDASPGSVVQDVVNRAPAISRSWVRQHVSPVFYLNQGKQLSEYRAAWQEDNWGLFLGEYLEGSPSNLAYVQALPRK